MELTLFVCVECASLACFLIPIDFLRFITITCCTKGQQAAVEAPCAPGQLRDHATRGLEEALPGRFAKDPQPWIPPQVYD